MTETINLHREVYNALWTGWPLEVFESGSRSVLEIRCLQGGVMNRLCARRSAVLSMLQAVLALTLPALNAAIAADFDNPVLDRMSVVAGAPGVPDHSVFSDLSESEHVSLYSGNLLITHQGSLPLPVEHGWMFALKRSYNSKNAFVTTVHLPPLDASNQYAPTERSGKSESALQGRTWIGLGWTMHLGRIFRTFSWDQSTCHYFSNPGECHDKTTCDFPQNYAFNERWYFEDENGTRIEFDNTGNGANDSTEIKVTADGAGYQVTRP